MIRYDLKEGLERLRVPFEMRPRIKYFEIRYINEFATGTPLIKPFFIIISTGDQVKTDFTIAHEVFGHGMDKNDYSKLPINERLARSESHARQVALEKLLELEQSHPNSGYLQYYDKHINKLAKVRAQILSINPWATLNNFILSRYYGLFVNFNELEEKRRFLPDL